ncbi:MAG: hypothetical protein LUD16_11925 [Lachnospiraceae bacterium]|nr:hypothetical protein [Lachnospiraceae bacterium]
MRILIYGAGVIGCELAHMLCKKNDITLLARGKWKETIDSNGLVIRHYVQRKTTVDCLKTINALELDDKYELIFVVILKNCVKRLAFPRRHGTACVLIPEWREDNEHS